MRFGPDSYLLGGNRYSNSVYPQQQEEQNQGGLNGTLKNGLDAYRYYQMFGGGNGALLAGESAGAGGAFALPAGAGGAGGTYIGGGGAGLLAGETAGAGGAFALPAGSGGAAGTSIGSGGGGMFSGMFGGGGSSGGMMGGMGAAALPLAVFGIPFMWAMAESGKHDKQLSKLRKSLGPEEVARRNKVARDAQTKRDVQEKQSAADYRKLHVNTGD